MSKTIDRLINYARRAANQELIIKYMRSLQFEFFTYETQVVRELKISEKYKKYAFMGRLYKGESGEFTHLDDRLIFGIKLVGRKIPFIIIFKDGKFLSKEAKPWIIKKRVEFRKLVIRMKFDAVMTYEERKIWRREHVKVVKHPEYQPSKFYLKHKKHVHFSEAKK